MLRKRKLLVATETKVAGESVWWCGRKMMASDVVGAIGASTPHDLRGCAAGDLTGESKATYVKQSS